MAVQDSVAETIGSRLRKARHALNLSLQQVAGTVHLSSATLSRIETDKQSLDLGLFVALTEALHLTPADFFPRDGKDGTNLHEELLRLDPRERARLWRDMAASSRTLKKSNGYLRRAQIRAMADEVEALLAQIEFLRQGVESLRRRLKNC